MGKVAAIIYSRADGGIRRLVVSDSIEELGAGQHYMADEDIIILDAADVLANGLPDQARMRALVDARCGVS